MHRFNVLIAVLYICGCSHLNKDHLSESYSDRLVKYIEVLNDAKFDDDNVHAMIFLVVSISEKKRESIFTLCVFEKLVKNRQITNDNLDEFIRNKIDIGDILVSNKAIAKSCGSHETSELEML